MTKLSEYTIRTKDRNLAAALSDITELWNGGKVSFSVVSTVPSDSPEDVEIRAYSSGAGVERIYIFIPGVGWRYSALTS